MIYPVNPAELLSLLEYKGTPLNGWGGTTTRVTTLRPNIHCVKDLDDFFHGYVQI